MHKSATVHLAMDGGDIPLIGHQPLIQINTKRPQHGQRRRVVVIKRKVRLGYMRPCGTWSVKVVVMATALKAAVMVVRLIMTVLLMDYGT